MKKYLLCTVFLAMIVCCFANGTFEKAQTEEKRVQNLPQVDSARFYNKLVTESSWDSIWIYLKNGGYLFLGFNIPKEWDSDEAVILNDKYICQIGNYWIMSKSSTKSEIDRNDAEESEKWVSGLPIAAAAEILQLPKVTIDDVIVRYDELHTFLQPFIIEEADSSAVEALSWTELEQANPERIIKYTKDGEEYWTALYAVFYQEDADKPTE